MIICVVNVQFDYGYEYLGNIGWLVIIFLIDCCYLIFIGVLYLKFGGVFVGFVGMGKIEIIKVFCKINFCIDINVIFVFYDQSFVIFIILEGKCNDVRLKIFGIKLGSFILI